MSNSTTRSIPSEPSEPLEQDRKSIKASKKDSPSDPLGQDLKPMEPIKKDSPSESVKQDLKLMEASEKETEAKQQHSSEDGPTKETGSTENGFPEQKKEEKPSTIVKCKGRKAPPRGMIKKVSRKRMEMASKSRYNLLII